MIQIYTKSNWISLFQSILLAFIAHAALTKHQMKLISTTTDVYDIRIIWLTPLLQILIYETGQKSVIDYAAVF